MDGGVGRRGAVLMRFWRERKVNTGSEAYRRGKAASEFSPAQRDARIAELAALASLSAVDREELQMLTEWKDRARMWRDGDIPQGRPAATGYYSGMYRG